MPSYSTPEGKFHQQQLQAKQRGIPWEFTFEQWWSVWQASGKWDLRGKKAGQYVMARHGDVGPYSASNVYICLATQNLIDARKNGCFPPVNHVTHRQGRKVRGWTFVKKKTSRPYQVMYGSKYVGSFATQGEAEAAHADAVARAVRAHDDAHFFPTR